MKGLTGKISIAVIAALMIMAMPLPAEDTSESLIISDAVKALFDGQNLEKVRTIAQVYKALPDEQKEYLIPIAETFTEVLQQAIDAGIIDEADALQITRPFTGEGDPDSEDSFHTAQTEACIRNMRTLESALEMFLMETEDLPEVITLDHLRVYLKNMELPECPCTCTSESYSIAGDLETGLYIKCECHGSISEPVDTVDKD